MKVAFVCGPFRSRDAWQVEQNVRTAEAVALELWRRGFAVFCPHTNTRYFDGAAPNSVWLKGDLEILSRCDLLVALPTWTTSRGARDEIAFARENKIPVHFWPDVGEEA